MYKGQFPRLCRIDWQSVMLEWAGCWTQITKIFHSMHTKKVRKCLGGSFSVNSMDKVEQFLVIGNCSSQNSSGIKGGYVYPYRETVISMVPNTPPEERQVAKLFENQTCIAQTKWIGPRINTLKTNLPLIGGKASELSIWYHRGPILVDFSNIHYNWGETATARDQPENMGITTAHQEFTNMGRRWGGLNTSNYC